MHISPLLLVGMAHRTAEAQKGLDFDTAVKHCPVTQLRPPATELEHHLSKPNVPRANLAVTWECPNGTAKSGEVYKDYVGIMNR